MKQSGEGAQEEAGPDCSEWSDCMVGSLLDSEVTLLFFFYFTLEWSSFHKEGKYGKWTSKYNFIHVADQCGSSFLLSLHYSLWAGLHAQHTYLCNHLQFIQRLLIENSKTIKTVKFALSAKPPSHSPDFLFFPFALSLPCLLFPHVGPSTQDRLVSFP